MDEIWTKEGLLPYVEKFFPGEAFGTIEEIGDGNINYVCRYTAPSGKTVIFKKADRLLKSSGRPLDQGRMAMEAGYLERAEQIAPGYTPHILSFDAKESLLVMEDIGSYKNLRTLLLEGTLYPGTGKRIAEFLSAMLVETGSFLMEPEKKKDLVKRFINPEMCAISEDLVLKEPYYNDKNRNQIYPGEEAFVKRNLYENQVLRNRVLKLRMKFLDCSEALLHGDLHTGSIFVKPCGVKIIDSEFAFFGPAGYDIGNVLAHFLIAYITGQHKGRDKDFLLQVETEMRDFYESVFRLMEERLIKEANRDFYTDRFLKAYIENLKEDTLGYAGTEIIRRTVGDTSVPDITSVPEEKRLASDVALLNMGIRLVMGEAF